MEMNVGSKRIGLLINDTNSDYVKEIIDGTYSFCEEKNSSLFIFGVGELDLSYRPFDYHQRYLAQLCNKHNIDGLVACSSVLGNHSDPERLEKYVKGFSEVPLVSVGARIPGFPCVLSDARPGLVEVLDDFIVNHGRRKFCVVGKIPGSSEAVERTNIVADYLPLKGRRFDDACVIDGNFTYESAMKGLDDYWERKGRFEFDAVIALNDDMAFAALDFCAKHKIQVPQQVCVAGFDDVPRAELCHPSLTTVNLNVFEQGRKAAEALFNIFEKKRVADITSVSSSARFRSSCPCLGDQELGGGRAALKHDGRSVSTEWLDKKRQFYIMNDFLASEQARLNLAKFRKLFKGFAERFDIDAAAVCVYESPVYVKEKSEDEQIPSKAFLLASYDKRRDYVQNVNESPLLFNPRETIIPPGTIDFSSGLFITWIISICENQYGYLVFKKGAYEGLVYSMMCAAFSRLLGEAWESSKAEKAAKIQQERTARLNLISKTDELTGLLNRRGFMELGQQTIDIAVVLNQGGVVIFGDMDGLKRINDTYGHDAGDRAIKAEAEILRKNFRASDIVGRLGGDEFVIIAAGLSEPRLSVIRENIDAACKAWNIVHNESFELSISLGCKAFSKDFKNLEEILKEADGLLYEEKRVKKNARR